MYLGEVASIWPITLRSLVGAIKGNRGKDARLHIESHLLRSCPSRHKPMKDVSKGKSASARLDFGQYTSPAVEQYSTSNPA
jgi:hypothetical protein